MMPKDDPFDSAVRHALWRVVKERPGIHFRALGRAARVSSLGHLRHHLDHLERRGLVVEVEDGRYKRFFVAGDHHAQVRRALARFARPVPRRIGRLLLARPMTRTELRRTLGCADSTLGYHLSRMLDLGDLMKTRSGNNSHYELADPDFVRRAILVHDGAGPQPLPFRPVDVAAPMEPMDAPLAQITAPSP